jgi:hypothetical protein
VHHLACQPLGGEIHLFFSSVVEAYAAVFLEREGNGFFVAVLHLVLRELEPSAANAEGNLFSADFDYGVLRCVESVGGCVTAEQRRPGGPEFGVEAFVDCGLRFRATTVKQIPCGNDNKKNKSG